MAICACVAPGCSNAAEWTLPPIATSSAKSDRQNDEAAQPSPARTTTDVEEFKSLDWSGCKGFRQGKTTQILCQDARLVFHRVHAQLEDDTGGEPLARPEIRAWFLQNMVAELKEAGVQFKAGLRITPHKARREHVLRARVIPPQNQGRALFYLARVRGSGNRAPNAQHLVFASCEQPLAQKVERCQLMTRFLVDRGLPSNLPLSDKVVEVRLLNQILTIPDGCRSHTGEDIRCENAGLTWEEFATGTDVDQASQAFHTAFVQPVSNLLQVKPLQTQRPCRVRGQPAWCTQSIWTVGDSNSKGMSTLYATLRSADPGTDHRVAGVLCHWTLPTPRSAKQLPEVCKQVFRWTSNSF